MLVDLKPFFAGPAPICLMGFADDGAPTLTRALAVVPDWEANEVLVLASAHMTPKKSLEGALGKQVAIIMVTYPSHEAFQIKGPVLEARSATAAEDAVTVTYTSRLTAHLQSIFGPFDENIMGSFARHEHVALRVRVEQIFDQRPRQGAGASLQKAA